MTGRIFARDSAGTADPESARPALLQALARLHAELERIDTMIAFARAQLDRAEAALRALEERAAACRRPGP